MKHEREELFESCNYFKTKRVNETQKGKHSTVNELSNVESVRQKQRCTVYTDKTQNSSRHSKFGKNSN